MGGFCFLLLTICTHRPWTKQFLGHENGKQLQVTTIKITESKENKSIHRLDLSGSTGAGGRVVAPLPPPPLATALLILLKSKYWFAMSASWNGRLFSLITGENPTPRNTQYYEITRCVIELDWNWYKGRLFLSLRSKRSIGFFKNLTRAGCHP